MDLGKNIITELQPIADIVAPADLQITKDGGLFLYLSDFLEDTCSASKAAVEWACGVVNDEGVKEHNLALTINLPDVVDELLEFSNEGTAEDKLIPVANKPQFDALRAQLMEAVARLDRVHYKY